MLYGNVLTTCNNTKRTFTELQRNSGGRVGQTIERSAVAVVRPHVALSWRVTGSGQDARGVPVLRDPQLLEMLG